jgi:hypothetical protein
MTAYGARAGPAGTIWRCLLIGEDRKWPVGGQKALLTHLGNGRLVMILGSSLACQRRGQSQAILNRSRIGWPEGGMQGEWSH